MFLKATSVTYSDEIIRDGINSGCKAILPWVPKRAVEYITVTSGSLLELPSDVYLVDAVMDPDSNFVLKRMSMTPGAIGSAKYPEWFEYPSGYITLSLESTAERYKVFFFTNWSEVVTTGSGTSSDMMDTPAFTDLAVVYYAISYCLGSAATQTSQLRQFNTKIDSGNPEDNPLKEMSNLMMQRFLNEMKLMPVIEKARQ